ncbi:MAG: MCE family protein [Calditrichaeota bacterium]|nr:MAG: MCE family protein [Calditrichota bacterium]
MEIRRTDPALKIGVITLFVLALFIASFLFYVVASNQKMFESKYSLYIFMPNIQGLRSGAFVTLAGMKVGVVGDLRLAEHNGQKGIRVELKIDRDYADQITPSSRATMRTMGVLGDKYVDISLGDVAETPLPPGSYLEMTPTLDIDEMLAKGQEALDNLHGMLRNIEQITDDALSGKGLLGTLLSDPEAKRNLVQMLASLSQLTSDITGGNGSLGRLMTDTTFYGNLKETTEGLQQITRRLSKGEGTLGKMLNDSTLYVNLSSLSARADSILARLQGSGTAGKLLTDKELYEQLVALTRSLTFLTDDLKKNPGRYVTVKIF